MKRFLFIAVSLTLLVLFPFSLLAQEKEITLEEVVVTATRDVQEIRKVPANVTVITREEIEKSNARTTVDLLREEVGVVVRDWFGTGKSAQVDIRGFGETAPVNTLVLVDGRRVNEIDLSGADWVQIPIDQVERIEILRGPGTVLYGDNAVGGVVNIITKKPDKPFAAKGEVVRGGYLYHKESGSVSGKWGSLSSILHAAYSSTEGYRENGFLRYKDFGGKMLYEIDKDISLNFSGNLHIDDYGLPGALSEQAYKLDRRSPRYPHDKAATEDSYGSFGIKVKELAFGRIEADLSYRHRKDDAFYRSFSYQRRKNLDTWGITPRYVLERPLWRFPNKFIFGIDFYRSQSKLFTESAFMGPNRLVDKKRSTGVYLLDEFYLLQDLLLSMGYRHEWVIFDHSRDVPSSRDTARNSKPAWTVGLDYLFSENSSAFISVKRSFRFPVTDEFVQEIIDPMTWQVVDVRFNPDLKPQSGYHYDTGIRHAFSDRIETNLTLFWADLRNEIFYNPYPVGANENYPKTRRRGFEVGVNMKPLDWLSLWGNYCYVQPILRGDAFSGSDIPGVPRHKGALGADVYLGKGFSCYTRLNLIGDRYFISDWTNQAKRLDGYYTLDAKLSYSWKGLKAFVGVNNLTDRKYAEHGVLDFLGRPNYYPSPERNYFGGISYAF